MKIASSGREPAERVEAPLEADSVLALLRVDETLFLAVDAIVGQVDAPFLQVAGAAVVLLGGEANQAVMVEIHLEGVRPGQKRQGRSSQTRDLLLGLGTLSGSKQVTTQ